MKNQPASDTRFAYELLQLALQEGADEAEVYVRGFKVP